MYTLKSVDLNLIISPCEISIFTFHAVMEYTLHWIDSDTWIACIRLAVAPRARTALYLHIVLISIDYSSFHRNDYCFSQY